MKRNAWQDAALAQLRAAGGPLSITQIWQRMEASGFQHHSKVPKSTLGARVAELVQMKKLKRVGPATYRLVNERHVAPFGESQQETRVHTAAAEKLALEAS